MNPGSKDVSDKAIGLLDSVLFVVIVLELLDTVLAYLRDHTFALRPFLIIGIISSVRHILVIGAKLSESSIASSVAGGNPSGAGTTITNTVAAGTSSPIITGQTVELLASAVVALLLMISYWLVGKVSDGREAS